MGVCDGLEAHATQQDVKCTFEPKNPNHQPAWDRLSEAQRRQRVEKALKREEIFKTLETQQKEDESERQALKRLFPDESRANILRWKKKYAEEGLEGLINWSMPPYRGTPPEVCNAICTLRRENPKIKVKRIIEHVQENHQHKISKATVNNILHKAGLSRPGGRAVGDETAGLKQLECCGVPLIEVLDVNYGCTEAFTRGIESVRDEAVKHAPKDIPVDTSGRDELGQFLSSYNERYRKKPGDVIGPGYLSVDVKREDKDPHCFQLNQMGSHIIQRKVIALMMKTIIAHDRWEKFRMPQGELFEEFCGYPYMPSTLDKFSRELKYLGVSETLWEIHARLWLKHSRHGPQGQAGQIIFVDGTDKPSWTGLFSESARISSVGKVMPGLEVVCFHTGNGLPLLMTTYSGHAPLVRQVPQLLAQMTSKMGDETVGKIIVIDAEGNSIPFLKGLEKGERPRAWVTRLKSSLVRSKRIFNRSNYKAYRNGDRIRMGEADFNNPDGGTFRMRVIEIERRSKGTVTYIGASLLLDEKKWKPEDIADLYFKRWPNQEANFRAVNQATGYKNINGYGKELVDNVSVLTDLDKLANRIGNSEAKQEKLSTEIAHHQKDIHERKKELNRDLKRQETIKSEIETEIKTNKVVTGSLMAKCKEQKKLEKKIDKEVKQLEQRKKKVEIQETKLSQVETKLDKDRRRYSELEGRSKIFAHDVELDSFCNLLKTTFVYLIQCVLKELFDDAKMDPNTFIERIVCLPGHLRVTPQLEIVTFGYNRRDPEAMSLLMSRCDAINAMKLRTRSGRILRIAVEPSPPKRKTAKPGKSKKRNRFVREIKN